MQWKTLAGFSVLGMVLSSLAVVWLTSPTATAKASPVTTPGTKTPSLESHLTLRGDIELDARVGHARLDARADSDTYLLFQARARESATRPPVAIALLVDHSGSMKGRRLENAISAARGLVARLREGDHLSVIGYDKSARVLVPTTQIDAASRQRVVNELGRVVASGSTCVSCALEAGTEALGSSALTNAVKQIVLLTDGEATTGVKSLDGFQSLARRAREAGIGVSSIGIDLDYNEALLSTLARLSNGRHHFVRNPGDLEQAFDRELGELGGSVANNARISLELPSDVELVDVFDRDVERDGNRLTVRFGSFTKSDRKTLLIAVRMRAGASRQAVLASFEFEYDSVGDRGRTIRNRGTLGVDIDQAPTSELDSEVSARIGQGRTGALLFEAGKLYSSGEPEDYKKLDQRFADEIERVERQKKTAKAPDPTALEEEKRALVTTRDKLRVARSAHCGCAPGDLTCAMSCSSKGKPKPTTKSCAPGDPLCANIGDLSGDEKAAAKDSVGSSTPFLK
jgi:Ca-activated chloride channel family protein